MIGESTTYKNEHVDSTPLLLDYIYFHIEINKLTVSLQSAGEFALRCYTTGQVMSPLSDVTMITHFNDAPEYGI